MDGIRASLSGIQAGLRRLFAAAAPAPSEPAAGTARRADEATFSERAIELLRAEHEVAVNAAALRRQHEAQDALLDALD